MTMCPELTGRKKPALSSPEQASAEAERDPESQDNEGPGLQDRGYRWTGPAELEVSESL